jgi:hypothetical protein
MGEKSPIFRISCQLLPPSSSSGSWQNHILLGHPTTLFLLNFNSNTLLGIKPTYDYILFGSVMVRVLATGPKVLGFKPSQGDGFLKVTKIRSTPSFRGELWPEAPCCKILWHTKNHLQV